MVGLFDWEGVVLSQSSWGCHQCGCLAWQDVLQCGGIQSAFDDGLADLFEQNQADLAVLVFFVVAHVLQPCFDGHFWGDGG